MRRHQTLDRILIIIPTTLNLLPTLSFVLLLSVTLPTIIIVVKMCFEFVRNVIYCYIFENVADFLDVLLGFILLLGRVKADHLRG